MFGRAVNSAVTPFSRLGSLFKFDEEKLRVYARQRQIRGQYEKKLKANSAEYKTDATLRIVTITYNVAEGKPLGVGNYTSMFGGKAPDLVAIGLQEVDMSGSACVLEETSKADPWYQVMLGELNSIGHYEKLGSSQLVGLVLMVFAKKEHVEHIHHVRKVTVRSGAMGGMVGNKGALGLRLSLYCRRVCFITAHFIPHKDNVEERNQNYHQIYKDLKFDLPPDCDDELDSCLPLEMVRSNWQGFAVQPAPYGFKEDARDAQQKFDYMFWFGDLNYRIWQMDIQHVKMKIGAKDYETLRAHDQLTGTMADGAVFKGWGEGLLNFDPTYKYDKNTDTYDTSEKQRTPSWTDRVLYYPTVPDTHKGTSLVLVHYGRFEYTTSDHRPVAGHFDAGFCQVDLAKFEDRLTEVVQELKETPVDPSSEDYQEAITSARESGQLQFASATLPAWQTAFLQLELKHPQHAELYAALEETIKRNEENERKLVELARREQDLVRVMEMKLQAAEAQVCISQEELERARQNQRQQHEEEMEREERRKAAKEAEQQQRDERLQALHRRLELERIDRNRQRQEERTLMQELGKKLGESSRRSQDTQQNLKAATARVREQHQLIASCKAESDRMQNDQQAAYDAEYTSLMARLDTAREDRDAVAASHLEKATSSDGRCAETAALLTQQLDETFQRLQRNETELDGERQRLYELQMEQETRERHATLNRQVKAEEAAVRRTQEDADAHWRRWVTAVETRELEPPQSRMVVHGALWKMSPLVTMWQRRMFHLEEEKLAYEHDGDRVLPLLYAQDIASVDDCGDGEFKEVPLHGSSFTIVTTRQQRYHLCAESPEDRERWVTALTLWQERFTATRHVGQAAWHVPSSPRLLAGPPPDT